MKKFLITIFILGALSTQGQLPNFGSVSLGWNRNSESDLAGYKVYYSWIASTNYTQLDVGNVTSTSLTNLVYGRSYSFYVTAYNTSGLESSPSSMIMYTVNVPPPIPPFQVQNPVILFKNSN